MSNDLTADGFVPRALRRPGVARRAAILQAAAELFLEQGYERTNLADITTRAGGSKSMIYEQFGDKAGLFRAVMFELCENIFQSIDGAMPKGKEPRDVLTSLGRRFIQALLDNKLRMLTRLVYAEGPSHPEVAEIFFSYGYDAGFERLARYLETIAPTRLSHARRLQLAMIYFEMVKGDAVDRSISAIKKQRSRRELDEQVEMAVNWLLQMLGTDAANASKPLR